MHPTLLNRQTVSALTLLLLVACAKDEKAKPDLAMDLGKTLDAITPNTPGTWQEVQTVESAHPYANHEEQVFTVQGDPATTRMLVVLERFELETGYDYLYVSDAGGAQQRDLTGSRTGDEFVIAGNQVDLVFDSDFSVTDWGFKVVVYEEAGCVCTAIAAPVCGVDGNTYGNACQAGCASVPIAYNSACQGSPWFRANRTIESPHNYPNNYDNTWTISEGGARFIRVHFPRIDVERGYDFLTVEDGAGNVVARYTGADTDVTSPVIAGDTAVIRLVTDYSVQRFGFTSDWYEVIGGCNSNADCGAGEFCNTQINCIRAPCFAVCEPTTGGGYTDVTVADLETNPSAYDGMAVRVVTEPVAGPVACTRRGCTQSNPCCNSCTAGLVIGSGIALRSASGQGYGCSGNECNWESTCDPFPPAGAGPYELLGTFSVGTFGSALAIDTFSANDCLPRGCSGHMCTNGTPAASTCIFQPEYACYQTATCAAQANGHCGWTDTPELQMCIDNARSETYLSTDTPVAIPDNNPNGAAATVSVRGLGPAARVLASVSIAHTYRGDLLVDLISPSGETFRLHDGSGGSAHDLVFTDLEVTGAAGLERNGTWTLFVVDRYARDTGTIDTFQLAFQ